MMDKTKMMHRILPLPTGIGGDGVSAYAREH